MLLRTLMENIPARLRQGNWDIEINDLTDDSRKVSPGCLFICIRGMEKDGHDYIPSAAAKKAAAVLVDDSWYQAADLEKSFPASDIPVILSVENTRAAAPYVAASFFGHPSRLLRIIGVTGTKGKTTTTFMIRDILEKAGYKTGLLGTIDYEAGGGKIPSERTTPEAIDIQRYLRQMADAGCQFAVMEVSSQGLKLHRTDAIAFDAGVFTNLGHDHISLTEHADMAEYAACKALLFHKCRLALGNRDDPWFKKIFEGATGQLETFGCEKPDPSLLCAQKKIAADHQAENITLINQNGRLGTLFSLEGEEYMVAIPGIFSVYNALAAIAVCRHFGIETAIIKSALSAITVKGRVEEISLQKPYRVLIDYAHNAMSLQNILTTLRRYHPRRLMVLFGCGGGRSRARRREMGQTAGKYADFTVITSDNPRYENPEAIMREIQEGIVSTGGEYIMIADRRQAIRHLLAMALPGDILVLAGKGHEMYQETAGCRTPFDERKIVKEILSEND